jgi:hypothetical protein
MNNLHTYDEFIELNEKVYSKPVQSSHLASLEYDDDTEELKVGFLNGSIYKYEGVPLDVYKELANYKSALQKVGGGLKKLFRPKAAKAEEEENGTFGTRFWEIIRRGKYKYEKIQ